MDRVFRVGQLDADLLDAELVQLLKDPLNKTLSLLGVCVSRENHWSLHSRRQESLTQNLLFLSNSPFISSPYGIRV